MNQKSFAIIFTLITLVAVGTVGLSKIPQFSDDKQTSTSQTELDFINTTQDSTPSPILSKLPKRYSRFPGTLTPAELTDKKAVIQTKKGIIEFEIYPEATKAASNFIFLARDGFYDGLTFHRIEPGFVIQGGDPLGNGTGGPGYAFEDEPVTRQYLKGVVAMANAGPNTNGSQFFIMLGDNLNLPPKYTIFGRVLKGQEVVEKIGKGDVMESVTITYLK